MRHLLVNDDYALSFLLKKYKKTTQGLDQSMHPRPLFFFTTNLNGIL
jgi:hypothetical protein